MAGGAKDGNRAGMPLNVAARIALDRDGGQGKVEGMEALAGSGEAMTEQRRGMKKGLTVADYPELAAEWHPTKNGNLEPCDVSAGSNNKVWWKCYKGKWPDGRPADDHEWEASPKHRTHGTGCSCCRGFTVVPSNCLATTHPQIAAQWHPNNSLTPFDLTAGSTKKVKWKCYDGKWPDGTVADDHEWEAKVADRTAGAGCCPCCRGMKVVPSKCLDTTHPELAAEWHPTKNGSLTPRDVTAGVGFKVWWKCYKGKWPDGRPADDHEWETTPNSRTNPCLENGCPCCRGLKIVPSNCIDATHPELAAEWHPTKNGRLTPRDVGYGCPKNVWWKCSECGHAWHASISSRQRSGCPRCRKFKGEKAISDYLLGRHIPCKHQWGAAKHGLPRQKFDFAVNRNDEFWLIEYHGRQHYLPGTFGSKKDKARLRMLIDALRRDHIKELWCKKHQKNLLIIPYWDLDRIDEILDEFFAGKTPVISAPPETVEKYEPIRQKIIGRIELVESARTHQSA